MTMKKSVSIWMEEDFVAEIEKAAERLGISRSDYVNMLTKCAHENFRPLLGFSGFVKAMKEKYGEPVKET
jgi:antitoxin component of RelBE/YafQ-DinJ toxin-antitoxin module